MRGAGADLGGALAALSFLGFGALVGLGVLGGSWRFLAGASDGCCFWRMYSTRGVVTGASALSAGLSGIALAGGASRDATNALYSGACSTAPLYRSYVVGAQRAQLWIRATSTNATKSWPLLSRKMWP